MHALRVRDDSMCQWPTQKASGGPLWGCGRGLLHIMMGLITNATDFKGSVVGFYGEQSKALAGVANMIADAQTAKWQARHSDGREPTDHTLAATRRVAREQGTYGHCHEATKLNAQVQLTNLLTMYERDGDLGPTSAA